MWCLERGGSAVNRSFDANGDGLTQVGPSDFFALPLQAQKARNRFGLALKPKRWRTGCGSDSEGIAVFAMKHIQPFRPRLLNTVPMHYLLAFRAIGIRNYC